MTREQLDAIRARVEAGTARGLSTLIEIDRDGTTRWVNLGPYPCATHEDAAQVRDIVTFVHAAPADLRALLAEVERLTDEGDAAFARGVAAMREAAGHAYFFAHPTALCGPTALAIAKDIRALPDPENK